MGRIFRKTRDGKLAGPYQMRFRNAAGVVVERSTGCKHKDSAAAVLQSAMQHEERLRSGLISRTEASAKDWQCVPLVEHAAAYERHMKNKDVTPRHVDETQQMLKRIFAGCQFAHITDLSGPVFEHWLFNLREDRRDNKALSPRRRNLYLVTLSGFCNWLVRERRAMENPFKNVSASNERVDRRRTRRVLSDDEIGRLLDAAQRRPLVEKRVNRGTEAGLKPETIEKLTALGRERALCYRLMMELGLRAGEVRGLEIRDLRLEGASCSVTIRAELEKARRGAELPLPADLACELHGHLSKRIESAQGISKRLGSPIPARLHPLDPVFPSAPSVKVLDRDLRLAGISKSTTAGTVDLHALRHTCATRLARLNVHPATAQKILRHATVQMTLGIYTHANMDDLRAAVELARPSQQVEREALAMAENEPQKCPPQCPPKTGKTGHFLAQEGGIIAKYPTIDAIQAHITNSPINTGYSSGGNDWHKKEMENGMGLEPMATGLKVRCSTN